jgi:hypothetical protein
MKKNILFSLILIFAVLLLNFKNNGNENKIGINSLVIENSYAFAEENVKKCSWRGFLGIRKCEASCSGNCTVTCTRKTGCVAQ